MGQFENATIRDLSGKEVTLAALRGQPVSLSFWETSCIPCVKELPSIMNLAASMGDTPLDILLVTFEDEARLRKFVGSQRLPVYSADERTRPKVLTGHGVPQTYILD